MRKVRRTGVGIVALLLVAFLVLTACGGGGSTQQPTDTGGTSGETTPPEEPLTVSVALGADVRTTIPISVIDWTTRAQLQNIFDAGFARDPETAEIIPHLITEYKIIDDLTWEFKIRDDVKWHNGDPLTAEDFKFSIEYMQDPANESHYQARWAPVSKVEIVDPYTFRIYTSEPFPILVHRFTEDILIMPKKYYEEVGKDEFEAHPIGTGPYKFVSRTPDQEMVLEKNPDYFLGEPEVDQVTFKYMPEFSSRLAALLANEIDIIKDVPPRAVDQVNNSKNARVESTVSSRINYVALVNLKPGPMQDVRVRRAMNLAVDVPTLIKTVLDGRASQIAGALSPLNSGYNPNLEPYGYDPDKAVELIKEAGYEPAAMNLVMDSPSGRYPKDEEVSLAIADQLSKIEIPVEVVVNEWGTHLDKIVNRQTGDMFFLGWGPALEPQGTIEPLFQGDWTYSGFTDPELEELIPQAVQIVDEEARQQAFWHLQELIWDKAPWIFLWQQHDLYGVSNKINWSPRPDEMLWMFEASKRSE